MIQRIQTVFLFFAAIFAGLMFLCPIAAVDYGTEQMLLTILGVENQLDAEYFSGIYTLPLLILTILTIIVPIFTVFKFKNRQLQIKLSSLNVFLNAIICGLIFLYYSSNMQKTIASDVISYSFGTYIPLINMILSVMAMRWIKKDIDLIRSIDRLR
ncbi:MAG: DUF4293 family protein [Lentimicrobiaceae bacterium]|nr:DUF4293 family protein [Lentimicrobiaceae bacterium]